jgi:alpha-1,2-mannosyltransferase
VLLCAVTGLLVSPITWAHHLVWIIPVILWLALAHDGPAYGRICAALAAVWFWVGPIWRIPHRGGLELSDTFAQLLVGNSYTIAMLVFASGMIVLLALRHSGARSSRRDSADGRPVLLELHLEDENLVEDYPSG